MPFYPTPNRDDGYDVADYLAVDPRLGDLGDVPDVIRHARDRGLRVIVDLVVNHTSDQHPGSAQRGRIAVAVSRLLRVERRPRVREREEAPRSVDVGRGGRQYYNHSFAPFQPDLNMANPAVRDEIAKIVGFWLALAFPASDGRRALPGRGGQPARHRSRRRQALAARPVEYAMRRSGDAMLMGEANVAMQDIGSSSRTTATRCTCSSPSSSTSAYGWRSRAATRARSRTSSAGCPCRRATRAGDLPAQPRRAHARQARAGRARRGLRGLRAAGGHADLRPRIAAEPLDARRRRSAAAHGLVAALLAAGHARDALRRRDRHGRGPRARGPDERAHADALGPRGRAGAHVRLAPALRAPRRPPAPRCPGAGLGRQHPDRNEPTALFARRSDWQGSTVFVVHNLSAERVAAELDLGEDVEGSTTCSSSATTTSPAADCASSSTRTATCGCELSGRTAAFVRVARARCGALPASPRGRGAAAPDRGDLREAGGCRPAGRGVPGTSRVFHNTSRRAVRSNVGLPPSGRGRTDVRRGCL